MTVSAHLEVLNQKHKTLSEQIEYAHLHHLPDNQIKELKLKKLQLKEEIMGMSEAA